MGGAIGSTTSKTCELFILNDDRSCVIIEVTTALCVTSAHRPSQLNTYTPEEESDELLLDDDWLEESEELLLDWLDDDDSDELLLD